ncbi:MAG: hypothetical protein FWH26_10070 [Oscillospiraceae bacterium]|nr:hypothetical protein [Oscillospiraceae bacterium]
MKRPENSQADQTNQTNNDSYHNGQNQKPGGLQRLLRNNRFLLALSMVLAVWVWVILVMANGDTQQRVLTVPVEIDFT